MSRTDKTTSAVDSKQPAQKVRLTFARDAELRKDFDKLLEDSTAKAELLERLQYVGNAPLGSDYIKKIAKKSGLRLGKPQRFGWIEELVQSFGVVPSSTQGVEPGKTGAVIGKKFEGLVKWFSDVFFVSDKGSPLEALFNFNRKTGSKDEMDERLEFIKNLRLATLEFVCAKLKCSADELGALFELRYSNKYNITENAIGQYNEAAFQEPAMSPIQKLLSGNLTKDIWKGIKKISKEEIRECKRIAGQVAEKGKTYPFFESFDSDSKKYSTIKDFLDGEFFGEDSYLDILIRLQSPQRAAFESAVEQAAAIIKSPGIKEKATAFAKEVKVGTEKSADGKLFDVTQMRVAVLECLCDKFKCSPRAIKIAYETMEGDNKGVIGDDDIVKDCEDIIRLKLEGSQSEYDSESESKLVKLHLPKGLRLLGKKKDKEKD